MMHSLAHSILLIIPVNFIYKKKKRLFQNRQILFVLSNNKEIISDAITATSVCGMEWTSGAGPLLPLDTIWFITTKMDTFEVLTILRAQTTPPPYLPPLSKKRDMTLKVNYKLYLKPQVQTFRTSGIIPFLPSTKLQRYRTPRFAISCHQKIMSEPPQEDTYNCKINSQHHCKS